MRSTPWLLLLVSQAPFPVVIVVVLLQGQGQRFPALQPLVVARGLCQLCAQLLLAWPGLACREPAEWAVEWPHGGGAFTPVELLVVFSAQPIVWETPTVLMAGNSRSEHPSPAQLCLCWLSLQSLSCSPSWPAAPAALLCRGLCCVFLPWAQEPSPGAAGDFICSCRVQSAHWLCTALLPAIHPEPSSLCCFLPMTHTPSAWLDQCYFSLCCR